MRSSIAERLKAARKLKGYSLQDLAEALHGTLSRQALHKYEKGEVEPDTEKILMLSIALGVKPEFFYRTSEVALGEIEFRKKTSLPTKEIDRVKEITKDYLTRYLELENIMGIETEFKNPFDEDRNESYEDATKAAEKLREAWKLGLDPIYNVAELLEDNHIKVVELEVNEDFDGLQTWVNRTIPVVAYNRVYLEKSDRIRFTLLHELCHLLLEKKLKGKTLRDKEKYCDQFASAVLLPEESLKAELGHHRVRVFIPELEKIKQQYGVSMQAIVMRATDLGILNPNFKLEFFKMFSRNGWRKNEPVDYDGQEEATRFDQLVFRALAEDQISMSKAAELKNQRLAEFRRKYILPGSL
ncbi:MAG: XRE family transcriptional regulator [Flavobacteriales bacterium]